MKTQPIEPSWCASLLEHVEGGVDIRFYAAELRWDLEVVEAGICERLDDRVTDGELAVGCIRLRLDQCAEGLGRGPRIVHGAPHAATPSCCST